MCVSLRFRLAAILTVMACAHALGDSFVLDWYTIDGGGAQNTSGGTFVLSGTIGQHDAGVMTGGAFTLYGGFWHAAQSAPCSPCDTNCDGSINGFDIAGFVAALGGAPNSCSPCNSDTNGDGSVNGFDIGGFTACLLGP